MKDKHVEAVREKMRLRAQMGIKKYGVTTERQDINDLGWMIHAQEEAMDMAIYLERMIHNHTVPKKKAP